MSFIVFRVQNSTFISASFNIFVIFFASLPLYVKRHIGFGAYVYILFIVK
jgi:hypothetical protein